MNPMQEYVKQRIKNNKNFMCAITGATGSGKTYSALRFAERWDENFNADRIVFTPKEFLALLNSDTLTPGSVIVADEFGVSMNSRNWQSVSNQVINYVLQTFRSKNYIVFFTSPDFAFIDASARKLFHCHMMTKGINHDKKQCRVKPYMLQIDQRTGNVYYKFLKFKVPDKNSIKLSQIDVGLPSRKLINAYEKKKEIFVNNLNKEIEAKLFEKENKEIKKDKTSELKETQFDAIAKLREKGTKWSDIATLFNFTSPDNVRVWFSQNRKKYISS